MDVRCGRCGTEYEFDDALVSDRGTTVKCTNCGHQFKVHPEAQQAVPERWVVRTATGRELVYTSLRELQRGIAQRQVGPEDLLARGNQPPRPLGSIAELEPFFHGRSGASLRAPAQARTLVGVAPPAAGSYAGPLPHALPPPPVLPPRIPDTEAPTQTSSEAPTDNVQVRAPSSKPADPLAKTQPEMDAEPPTLPRNALPPEASGVPAPAVPKNVMIRESVPDLDYSPTPSDVRMGGYRAEQASLYMPEPHSRRLRSRWIAGFVLVGVAVLLAATVGRRYLEQYRQAAPQPQASADGRVAGFLTEAERKLDDGDFEGARGELDKASVLADKDAAVLAAMARLEAMRADTLWLKLRLLDPAEKQVVQTTHRQLGARVGKAKEALERAVAVAPDDPAVVRSRVDILRLAGDLKEARGLVAPLSSSPTGENAYVLAALDLAEAQPVWASVVDRLRSAAQAERSLGRARAALVYALVRAGQVDQAQSELDKHAAKAEGHPLYDDLAAFVKRHATPGDAGPDSGLEVAAVDPASLPMLDTSQAPIVDDEAPKGGPGDFRVKLQQAASAMKSGNVDRAEQLYNEVLAKEPGNTEAMAGLADVAKAKKDPEAAAKMYDKVLKENPSYLPALVARADQKWDSGDRKGALVLYRRVLEQAGAGSSYGQKAAQRIGEGEGPAAPPSTGSDKPPDKAPEKPPEPKPEEKKEEKPHIDTTDLPGVKP
ncbi:MAG: zinc-ribbon domain-containing protein [Myxococcales bacterium]|nr:zinc-ribbon domain-containing protein [Myxococcales bacterium]